MHGYELTLLKTGAEVIERQLSDFQDLVWSSWWQENHNKQILILLNLSNFKIQLVPRYPYIVHIRVWPLTSLRNRGQLRKERPVYRDVLYRNQLWTWLPEHYQAVKHNKNNINNIYHESVQYYDQLFYLEWTHNKNIIPGVAKTRNVCSLFLADCSLLHCSLLHWSLLLLIRAGWRQEGHLVTKNLFRHSHE